MSARPAGKAIEDGRLRPLGHFLFSHLRDLGVRHCFGVPGDYVLPLYKALDETSGIEAVVSTHEPCAAFSADAYGRMTGLGVLLVTYGVGGFNAMNGVACAYAESSPLLVVSGGPPRGPGGADSFFAPAAHHFVKHRGSQLDAYTHITDLALRVETPEAATVMIRRAADHAMRSKLPVYLEIPTDLMGAGIPALGGTEPEQSADPEILERAVSFFLGRIEAAQSPVIFAGEGVGRFRLQEQVRRIGAACRIPIATSILGKGIFDETQPGMLGVYAGALTPAPETRSVVEASDLVVVLGVKVTDVNCGIFTANLKREGILIAQPGRIGDGLVRFSEDIPFERFISVLADRLKPRSSGSDFPEIESPDYARSDVLMDRYLAVINDALERENVVIADTGDSFCGSLFMKTRRDGGYLSPSFYGTMGYAVPAALGVQLAIPDCRPVVLTGDGAFQMTGMEFSNLVSWGLNPIIVVFNNAGYGMQRILVDGRFNDIRQWDYGRIVDLVGGGRSRRVRNEQEMGEALRDAHDCKGAPSLIEAVVPKGEVSAGLAALKMALVRERGGVCPMNKDDRPCSHQDSCGFCRAAIWK